MSQLDEEREAHAQRVARLNIRETELRAREAAQRTAAQEAAAMRAEFENAQREADWVHWQRDRMRELMRELVTKRPTDEWHRRMERMHTALDLSERDNARLRADLARIAATGAAAGSDGRAAAAAAAAGAAAAAAAATRGGLQDELFAKYAERPLESPVSRSPCMHGPHTRTPFSLLPLLSPFLLGLPPAP